MVLAWVRKSRDQPPSLLLYCARDAAEEVEASSTPATTFDRREAKTSSALERQQAR
jgi:hypothetical protein